MTWEQFRNGVAVLLAAFPKLEPSEETVQVWFALLKDVSPVAFTQAVMVFCQSQREIYPGTGLVACLRDLALPETAPDALAAWGEVRQQIGRVGDYGLPQFSHSLIGAVVEDLGWKTLCLSEDIHIERAHFLRAYDQRRQRLRQQHVVAELLTKAGITIWRGAKAPTKSALAQVMKEQTKSTGQPEGQPECHADTYSGFKFVPMGQGTFKARQQAAKELKIKNRGIETDTRLWCCPR